MQLQDLSSSLPQLTELNLSGSKLSSTCSIPFSNLKILKLNGCGWVNDQTMSSIYNLSGLTSLDLSDTSVNEAGLLDFGRLPALRELNLWGIDGLSDRILIALRINTSLRSLALSSPVFSLRAAKDFQDSIPDARLHIPLHDFAELKPFLRPLTVTAQSSTDLGP